MTDPFWLLAVIVLASLASYRLWQLLAHDTILDAPRDRLPSKVRDFVECPWCCGFWISVVVTIVVDQVQGVALPVLVAFAVSGLVGLIVELKDALTEAGAD